jgi:hypothetical protein
VLEGEVKLSGQFDIAKRFTPSNESGRSIASGKLKA